MRHRSSSAVDDAHIDDAPTEVLPFGEFDAIPEVAFRHTGAFCAGFEVVFAPELDDLNDRADEQPLELVFSVIETKTAPKIVDPPTVPLPVRSGRHRDASRDTRTSRLLVAAMSGAIAAAFADGIVNPDREAVAHSVTASDAGTSTDVGGFEIVAVPEDPVSPEHLEEFARGVAYATERAQREARLLAPQSVMPTRGILTSAYGWRWGELHAGLDIANAVGTPIYAAADGVVVASGPTAGYGMWVKIRHADNSVTLYGHINTTIVEVGQRVMAGDQIATMGNRGNSTGPHLHFEVHRNGTDRIDPAAWLRQWGADMTLK